MGGEGDRVVRAKLTFSEADFIGRCYCYTGTHHFLAVAQENLYSSLFVVGEEDFIIQTL